MEKEPVGFFYETRTKKSSIRLYSFISLMAGILYAFTLIILDAIVKLRLDDNGNSGVDMLNMNSLVIFLGFLVGAFAPKVISKFAELKLGKISDA
jgi:hypothetical protein